VRQRAHADRRDGETCIGELRHSPRRLACRRLHDRVLGFEKLAEEGHAESQNKPGEIFFRGAGVPISYAKAAECFEAAARQGLATAQLSLAEMYEEGRGVGRNVSKAASLYLRAAHQGLATAQANIGRLYEQGHGVPQSYEDAVKCYWRAAAQGFEAARQGRIEVEGLLSPDEIRMAQRRARDWSAKKPV
jgi:hypothetical protein